MHFLHYIFFLGPACRIKALRLNYATAEEEEATIGINYFDGMPQPLQQNVTKAGSALSGEFLSYVLEHFVKLTAIRRMQLGSSLLQLIIYSKGF